MSMSNKKALKVVMIGAQNWRTTLQHMLDNPPEGFDQAPEDIKTDIDELSEAIRNIANRL